MKQFAQICIAIRRQKFPTTDSIAKALKTYMEVYHKFISLSLDNTLQNANSKK